MNLRVILLLLACLTMLQAQQPAAPKGPKPPVGLPADARLFNGKWYALILEKANWHVAQTRCKQRGGQLVVIHDEPTQAFIKSLTKLRVWLGATDDKVEGQWVWSDGKVMTFTAWEDGQPNNREGKEPCLRTGTDGRWCDHPKEWNAYEHVPVVGYICEWKAK